MSKIIVGKPIEGISLNGLEFLLKEKDGDIKVFENKEEVVKFFCENGVTPEEVQEMLDECSIVFCDAETQEML